MSSSSFKSNFFKIPHCLREFVHETTTGNKNLNDAKVEVAKDVGRGIGLMLAAPGLALIALISFPVIFAAYIENKISSSPSLKL